MERLERLKLSFANFRMFQLSEKMFRVHSCGLVKSLAKVHFLGLTFLKLKFFEENWNFKFLKKIEEFYFSLQFYYEFQPHNVNFGQKLQEASARFRVSTNFLRTTFFGGNQNAKALVAPKLTLFLYFFYSFVTITNFLMNVQKCFQ